MHSFDELIKMDSKIRAPMIGMKAENLMRMRAGGFNVPDGFVITTNELHTGAADAQDTGAADASHSNATDTQDIGAADVQDTRAAESLHADSLRKIAVYADENTSYAVRSSAINEDLEGLSFAGLYDSYLNVSGYGNLLNAAIKCAGSIRNERLRAYAVRGGVDIDGGGMAVIVQKMVDSEKSGVAFSIDSVNGFDKHIIIEATSGLGDRLVGGGVTPDVYSYNWHDDSFVSYDGGVLSHDEVKTLAMTVLDIQAFFGYPVDVEWAFAKGAFHILQSRPITVISYRGVAGEWTTADFRDGGVSSAACKPLMASLYGTVFGDSFLNSLKTIKLLSKTAADPIYQVFFSRPYWSLSTEKACFARLPGFVEREIDEDMGVRPTYKGDGVVTKTNLATLKNGMISLAAIKRHIGRMTDKAEALKADILARFDKVEGAFCARGDSQRESRGPDAGINPNGADGPNSVCIPDGGNDIPYNDENGLCGLSADEIRMMWLDFVKGDYYLSEYSYFSYIFCTMILSTLFKDKAKKYIPANEMMNLIIGLNDLSHLRPIIEMWDMSRRGYAVDEFNEFIAKHRYHSKRELDISYPNWDEAPEAAAEILSDFKKLGDDRSPLAMAEAQRRKYYMTLARAPRKLYKDIEKLRSFLWWREEFKDISTKSYYIIRKLSLALGRAWKDDGTLVCADDVFYLTVADIESGTGLRARADANRKYYLSFVNFKNPNELGERRVTRREQPGGKQIGGKLPGADQAGAKRARGVRVDKAPAGGVRAGRGPAGGARSNGKRAGGAPILKGVPCAGEKSTATARVIYDIHDAGRLKTGDILVTQCTDPAWTAVFSKIGGVITETGGMLSHAAVVSREYGLPCILLVKDATRIIRDGDIITMDCATGEIYRAT